MRKLDINNDQLNTSIVYQCLVVLTLIFTSTTITDAQRFKDIYPVVIQSEDEQALPMLNAYLATDLDHPSANLMITMIYDRRYKSANVLTEYEKAIANAQRAKLRLSKCSALVTIKEVKKNSQYYSYFSSGKDSRGHDIIEFATVSNAMINKNDSITLFLEKVPPIYKSFVNAVNNYDRAKNAFYQINSRYNSLDDLYLLYNDQLRDSLNLLKESYDSSLYYLSDYKSQISAYPVNNYKQDFSIKNIDTYRLSGLTTQSDFLSDYIELWNYGKWVDEVNALVDSDIAALRKEIISYEQKIDASLKDAASPANFDSFQALPKNKELLFKLKKYDNRSLLASMFQYKDRMQYLNNRVHNTSYYDTVSNIDHQNKYAFYGEMVNSFYLADSVIKEVRSRLNSLSVAKHSDFMQTYYQSYIGVGEYISKESKSVSRGFQEYIGTLRESIIDDIKADTISVNNVVRYGKRKIPLAVSHTFSIDSLQHGALVATHLKVNADGSRYTAGVHKKTKDLKNAIAYLARIAPNEKVTWYKEFDISIDGGGADADNFVTGMQLTPAGCAIVIRSMHKENKSFLNSLIYIDESGTEKLNKRLEETTYARTINYSESTNSFIVSFRGHEQHQVLTHQLPSTFTNINVIGDILWSVSNKFSGTLEDVVNTNNGYIVVGNFTAKKDNNGKEVRTKITEKQTNVYMDFITDKGVLSNTKLINSDKSFYFTDIVKINDSNISVLGHKGVYEPEIHQQRDDKDAVYLFTNAKLKVIYSDL